MMEYIDESISNDSQVTDLVNDVSTDMNKDISLVDINNDIYPIKSCELKDNNIRLLEDLDTNVDTTSIPESEFVSEYFDIYNSNDTLNKICTSTTDLLKWDNIKSKIISSNLFNSRTIDRLPTIEYIRGSSLSRDSHLPSSSDYIKVPPSSIPQPQSDSTKTPPPTTPQPPPSIEFTIPFFEDDFRFVSSLLKNSTQIINESTTNISDVNNNSDNNNIWHNKMDDKRIISKELKK